MGTKVEIKTSHSRKYITFHFNFLGNLDNCKVCLMPESRGDGEISTGHGGQRFASLKANVCKYNEDYLKFTFTYCVWEKNWNSKKNQDALYFTKSLYYSVRGMRYSDVQRRDNVTETTEQFWNLDDWGEAFYKDYYNTSNERHNFLPVNGRSYPNENHPRSWLPIEKLRFKIDDKGNELRGEGNIGVKGEVKLYLNLVKNVRTETKEDDKVNSLEGEKRHKGNCYVLPTIPEAIRSILCYGYDITKEYATINGVTKQILNLEALNEDKHLDKKIINSYTGESYHGSSIQEMNESRENKMSINMSFGLKGLSFAHEMTRTYNVNHTEKYGYKYLCIKDVYNHEGFKIDSYNSPAKLYSYLNEEFLRDLNRMSAHDFIRNYGTHVMLGSLTGARLNYNMRYRSSIIEHSEAKTFSTSSSFAFSRAGNSQLVAKDQKKPEESLAKGLFEGVQHVLANNPSSTDLLNIVKISEQFTKKAADKGTTSATPTGGLKIGAGVSTSESSSSSRRTEEENTEIICDGVGGKSYYCKMIVQDASAYQKWLDSIDDDNMVWCDFIPGTLVPIYKFVPVGYRNTAQDIKNAMEQYIKESRIERGELGRSVQPYSISLRDSSKCFNFAKENGRNQDPELSTQRNKRTGWKLKLELVNLPEGHIGVALWMNVAESGFHSGRSELQLRDVIDVSNGLNRNCAIPKEKKGNVWESAEFSIYGQQHGWINVTEYLRDCPYIEYNDGVLIHIDGSGDDYKHVGIQATFKVPYVYYND